MSWIAFAIAAPALYAVSSFIDKFLIEKRVKDPIALTIMGGVTLFIAAGIIFAIKGFGTFTEIQIFILLIAGLATALALVPYYKALSLDDTSRVVPFFQIIPVIVLILSYVILGERLDLGQSFAFIFILAGAFMLSVQNFGTHIFKIRKSFWWAMLAAILYAFPPVLFKLIVVNASFWETAAYEFVGGMIGTLILLIAYYKRFITQFPLLTASTWLVVTTNEGVYFAAQLANLFAIAIGPVALVSAIISLNPFFVLLFGVILSLWFPKIIEEDISKSTMRTKIIAVVLIIFGVWLINR